MLLIIAMLMMLHSIIAYTHAPTPAPTTVPVNGTITNGMFYLKGSSSGISIGELLSSNIQNIIDTYFPAPLAYQVVNNLGNEGWVNSGSNVLSYLTLTGVYQADTPLVLPSQFVLVMNRATLTAIPHFSYPAIPYPFIYTLAKIGNAIIVIPSHTNYTAVVSPGGPSEALVSCKNVDDKFGHVVARNPTGNGAQTGPDGIVVYGASNILIDGITVDSCGLTSANIALASSQNIEISNCIISNSIAFRGIWVIITTKLSIHDNEIFNSFKFGIDLDGFSGPFTIIHNNKIHDNLDQGVFIEQGSLNSVVSLNELYNNQNGVSFYNNLFPTVSANHSILSNTIYGNTAAGINVGSISRPKFLQLSIDSYCIGNIMYGNDVADTNPYVAKYGVSYNGPATGFLFVGNSDTEGVEAALLTGTASSGTVGSVNGGVIIQDPLFREFTNYKVSHIPPPPYVPTTGVMNGTFAKGVFTYGFTAQQSTYTSSFGQTCSGIQDVINRFYKPLTPASAFLVPWIWGSANDQVISFLNIVGDFQCDVPIFIPTQTIIAFENARLLVTKAFPASASGVVNINSSPFAGIVAAAGAATNQINCDNLNGKGPAGVYVDNAPYFYMDGISVEGCGSISYGAITVTNSDQSTPKYPTPGGVSANNNTVIANSIVTNSGGHGILATSALRTVIYNTQISKSAGSGVATLSTSCGVIVTSCLIQQNSMHGILIDQGSVYGVISGNTIQSNSLNGIMISNEIKVATANTTIVVNNILNNKGASIGFSTTGDAMIYQIFISGNTISGNHAGLTATTANPSNILNTTVFANSDSNGMTKSFLQTSEIAFDPMDRMFSKG